MHCHYYYSSKTKTSTQKRTKKSYFVWMLTSKKFQEKVDFLKLCGFLTIFELYNLFWSYAKIKVMRIATNKYCELFKH